MTVPAAEEAATAAKAAKTAKAARGARSASAGRASRARGPGTSAAASPAAETPDAAGSPSPAIPPGGATVPDALTDMRGAPGWYSRVAQPDAVAMSNAGGGFLLGLFAWAIGLAYLRGGGPEVKRLLAAKFLNRTSSAAAPAPAAAASPQRVGSLPLNTNPQTPIGMR